MYGQAPGLRHPTWRTPALAMFTNLDVNVLDMTHSWWPWMMASDMLRKQQWPEQPVLCRGSGLCTGKWDAEGGGLASVVESAEI